MNGTDEISRSLAEEPSIRVFETDRMIRQAWYPTITQAAVDAVEL